MNFLEPHVILVILHQCLQKFINLMWMIGLDFNEVFEFLIIIRHLLCYNGLSLLLGNAVFM